MHGSHLPLSSFSDFLLHPLEDAALELLQVLLQVEHHVLYDLVEHLQKFAAQHMAHLAFPLQVVLTLSDAPTENRDEVGGIGERFG